jgi:hypothetical protein
VRRPRRLRVYAHVVNEQLAEAAGIFARSVAESGPWLANPLAKGPHPERVRACELGSNVLDSAEPRQRRVARQSEPAAGGIGFLALAGACFVFARGFAAAVRPGWAVYSCATGMAFLAGFAGIIADSGNPAATVAFTAAVVAAWAWLAAISVLLYRDVTAATRPTARLEAGR